MDAASEAIDVIRGLWDVADRSRLEIAGTHHRLDGAKRGPAPAHPIGIWVGAYKPRMLRLIGQKADGWLASLSYLPSLGTLTEANRRIDDAALEAGRDPAHVRRLLNIDGRFTGSRTGERLVGPPQQWVEQLADLTLSYGITGFVLVSDDPTALMVLGQEVAPTVREVVAAGRG